MSDRLDAAVAELVDALRAELATGARPEPDGRGFVSIAEAAAVLSVGRSTVYALLDAGKLPSRKVGARRLIPRAALAAFTAGESRA